MLRVGAAGSEDHARAFLWCTLNLVSTTIILALAYSARYAGPFGAPSPFLSQLTDINAQAGWGVILDALAAAVVAAVLASAATTWMIGRIRPAEVLRSE